MQFLEFKSKAWLTLFCGAFFSFYSFFHCNLMNSLKPFMQSYFDISDATLSLSTAFFFYSNVIFLLPAGIILDRYPLKKVIMINMIIIIFSSLLLTLSTSIFSISLARFLGGIMASFSFIACLKLASILVPSSQMTLASSIIISISMLGGFTSQAPVTTLATWLGWRSVMFLVTCLGLFIMWILWRFVKIPENQISPLQSGSVLKSLSIVTLKKDNWFLTLFITLLNIPIAVLGAFFGIGCLTDLHGTSHIASAAIISMIFIGMLIGSPFFGWIANRINRKKILMYIGAFLCLILMMILLYLKLYSWQLYIIVFLIGFTSSAQVLGYPIITEINDSYIVGTALSFSSLIVTGIGYGIFLPLIGWLTSFLRYQSALLIIPISIAISIIFLSMFKEKKEKIPIQ